MMAPQTLFTYGALASLACAASVVLWERLRYQRLLKFRNRSETDWWRWYKAYLKTNSWQLKRDGILLRAQGRSSRCNRADRLQVHHLTYERVGFEHPGDLAALCYSCHQAMHPRRNFSRATTA